MTQWKLQNFLSPPETKGESRHIDLVSLFQYELNEEGHCRDSEVFRLLTRRGTPSDYLRQTGIYSDSDDDFPAVRSHLLGDTPSLSPEEDRAIGVFLGMVCGDALGCTLEFSPVTYDSHQRVTDIVGGGAFHLAAGQWTDDASMGLCMADSLLVKGRLDPIDLLLRFVAWWNFSYNAAPLTHAVGLGGTISQSLSMFCRTGQPFTTSGDSKSSGNGSIMRLSAVPVCYHDNEELGKEVAVLQSKTTHQGDEAAGCAKLMTQIIIRCIHRPSFDATDTPIAQLLLDNGCRDFSFADPAVMCLCRSEAELTGDNQVDVNRNWNWKQPRYRYSPVRARENPGYVGGYAMDALAMALHCVWTTNSMTEAILKAINLGGDADTVGSITGQIAGAVYGARSVPREWINKVQQWDNNGTIALRAFKLFHHKFNN